MYCCAVEKRSHFSAIHAFIHASTEEQNQDLRGEQANVEEDLRARPGGASLGERVVGGVNPELVDSID